MSETENANGLRTIVSRYWAWILSLVIVNCTIYFSVDRSLGRHLDFAARWPTRLALASALLLFDNLVVLWWYAHRTEEQARTAAKMFDLAQTQHEAARSRETEQSKPRVVIEYEWVEDLRGDRYVARNVGPAAAFNVLLITLAGPEAPTSHNLGTIESGGVRRLPQDVINLLRQRHDGTYRVFVICTPQFGDRWLVAENTITPNGFVRHRFQEKTTLSTADRHATWSGQLGAYLAREWAKAGILGLFEDAETQK